MNHIHGQCVRIARATYSRIGLGITRRRLSRNASPHSIGATLLAALLLVAAASLISTPARAGLLGNLLGSYGDSGSGKVAQLAFHLDDATIAPTTAVVWSPDGRFIATAGVQKAGLHIWDVAQRKLVKNFGGLVGPSGLAFHGMAWSPDGRYFAICGSKESSLRVYATKDWSVAKDFGGADAGACQKPAFSSDSQELTVWGYDLTTFATSDWHIIRRLKGASSYFDGKYYRRRPDAWDNQLLLHDMAYVPGTHTLVFGGGQYEKNTDACGPVAYPKTPYAGRVWILKSGATALSVADSFVAYCPPKGGDVQFLAFSPDGRQLATVTGVRAAKLGTEPVANTKIFSFPTGRLIATPISNANLNAPTGLVYTGDGRYLLVGDGGIADKDHAVFIVDAQTMQLLDTVHAPPNIGDIAAAPDSTMFAVATGAGVTVWKFVRP